jgi:hypothetical protein
MNWPSGQLFVKQSLFALSLIALGGASGALPPSVIVLAVMTPAAAPQRQPAAPPAAGTALLAGQVVDPGTGKPVPEALVTLWFDGMMDAGPRIMADAQGRFVFVNAPAGRYRIEGRKFGFLSGYHGQRTPNGNSAPVDLADGQILTDLVVPAWKTGAITGTVTDEAGEPVVGVRVNSFRKGISLGEVRLVPYDPFNITATTDDRGLYRLSNLPPGEYTVAVASTLTTVPAEVMQATQETGAIRSQAFFALRDLPTPLGDALNQQFGGAVLLTGNGTLIPPAAPGAELPAVYRTTFAPGTALPAEAAMIAVGTDGERTLNIALRPIRAVRVSGRLIGPEGPITHIPVRLIPTGHGRLTTGSAPLELATATARRRSGCDGSARASNHRPRGPAFGQGAGEPGERRGRSFALRFRRAAR